MTAADLPGGQPHPNQPDGGPLWCDVHDAVETYTPGEIERIVYALHAEAASSAVAPDGDRVHAGKDWRDVLTCHREWLSMGRDSEGYAELVDAWIEARGADPAEVGHPDPNQPESVEWCGREEDHSTHLFQNLAAPIGNFTRCPGIEPALAPVPVGGQPQPDTPTDTDVPREFAAQATAWLNGYLRGARVQGQPQPQPDDALRETELWTVLDWSLWGNGLGDVLREAMADTMITALPDAQRDQAEALIKAWHARRGPSMAVGVGTKLERERDEARAEVTRLTALLGGVTQPDNTPPVTDPTSTAWVVALTGWLHEHSECDDEPDPATGEVCGTCQDFAQGWAHFYARNLGGGEVSGG